MFDPPQEVSEEIAFVDMAAIHLMPLCVQLAASQGSKVAVNGSQVNVNVDTQGAAQLAYKIASVMWFTRISYHQTRMPAWKEMAGEDQ